MIPEAATNLSADLKRSLQLWHLIVYGVIIIQPTAPMPVYGVVSRPGGQTKIPN
jgi:putrescine importer